MLPTPPSQTELDGLCALFANGKVAVLTGAGISTESGIPDYRGPETRRRARNPVQWREFVRNPAARHRYWARSMLGWPRLARARPNAGHYALRQLEQQGRLAGLITQNVDGLHGAAGSQAPVELHGALRHAVCLHCARRLSRDLLQTWLERENAHFLAHAFELAPDGDADIADQLLVHFKSVGCECGGDLRPDVVFFGENVPTERVERAMAIVRAGNALLVVGSSLAVYSGLRFVREAERLGIPVAILTHGPTRGDASAVLRVDASAGLTLSQLTARLAPAVL
ncbi:MAG: NAD-dependent protein deacetylase [Myxococcales bacterium]